MARIIVVGDIHGCWDELRDLLDRCALVEGDLLVSVGDLVDRGPSPAEVLDLFRTRPNSVALCGNHERKHVRGVLSTSQQITRAQLDGRYADDVAWMGTLPYHLELPEVRVVHWGLYPGVPLDEVPEDVRAGTTSGELKLRARYGEEPWYQGYEDDVPVAFGHRIMGEEPLVLRDRVFGLDTGVCHGQRLTALVLPGRQIVSVPARADHWHAVRAAWSQAALQAVPWRSMTFDQIRKKAQSLRGEHPGASLDAVLAWSERVRAGLPTLADRLDAEAERLAARAHGGAFAEAVAGHPAASYLLRRQAGKLSREHLGCVSPEQVFALADALAEVLDVPALP